MNFSTIGVQVLHVDRPLATAGSAEDAREIAAALNLRAQLRHNAELARKRGHKAVARIYEVILSNDTAGFYDADVAA